MKTIHLVFLLIFLSLIGYSQINTFVTKAIDNKYQVKSIISEHLNPIANGEKVSWIVKNEIWDRAIIDTLFLADTITVNSNKYFKVLYSSEGFRKNNNLVGYFREDTIYGKAWFQGYLDSTEYLIMDLSLKKGDSIYVKMIYGNKYAHIINDEIIAGQKVLTTDYHYGGGFISENLKFIEGVGPNASIMYQIDSTTADEINQKFGFLICKQYKDSKLVYAWDTIHYECGLLWDNIDETTNNQISIYPNPVIETLSLKRVIKANQTATIYDALGTVKREFNLNTFLTTINVSEYKKGLYFIRIGSTNKKFIKQ
jgi:hypothetical protein